MFADFGQFEVGPNKKTKKKHERKFIGKKWVGVAAEKDNKTLKKKSTGSTKGGLPRHLYTILEWGGDWDYGGERWAPQLSGYMSRPLTYSEGGASRGFKEGRGRGGGVNAQRVGVGNFIGFAIEV